MNVVLDRQVATLLTRVQRHRDAACAAAVWDAERQTAALLADARREARARLRAAAREKRQRVAERCRQAAAAADAAARGAEFARERALLVRAAAALPLTLAARWRDARTRDAWARTALRLAARRLVSREWRIVAARGIGAEERIALLAYALELGARATLEVASDATCDAGLIVLAPGARLDATPRGLLADRQEIEARVLAELHRRSPS